MAAIAPFHGMACATAAAALVFRNVLRSIGNLSMRQDLGKQSGKYRGARRDKAAAGEANTTNAARSSGLPAWPPRPRPHFDRANPIIAESERQLDEIRRSRRNMGTAVILHAGGVKFSGETGEYFGICRGGDDRALRHP